MELTKDDVRQLAALARLRLTDDETVRYQHDLAAILAHVERLQSYMAGKDVVVDRRVLTSVDELRADEPNPSRTVAERDELLAGARALRGHQVEVPGVFVGEK